MYEITICKAELGRELLGNVVWWYYCELGYKIVHVMLFLKCHTLAQIYFFYKKNL